MQRARLCEVSGYMLLYVYAQMEVNKGTFDFLTPSDLCKAIYRLNGAFGDSTYFLIKSNNMAVVEFCSLYYMDNRSSTFWR